MADDVSKKTVAILLLIAVVVSVIGTWTTLTQDILVIEGDTGDVGYAKLKVLAPGELPSGASQGTGNAVLRVIK